MKLCILGPSEDVIGYTTKRLLEEAKKEFKNVELVPIADVKLSIKNGLDAVFNRKSLKQFDYILPRIDSKRAVVGYPVMRFLDLLDVKKPYLAETILLAHNKFLTLEQLASKGIPVPETYLTGSKKSAKEIMKKMKLPLMIKLLSSFGGHGVMVMESREAAETTIDTMKGLEQEVLLESFVKNPGEDIRGIVAGNEIIASYKRVAAEGEKRANIHSGGRASVFKLSEDMEEIVFKSAEAVKSKICAIDMLESKDGLKVIEVNINPGIEGIEKATDINVAQRIINFVKNEAKR